MNEPLDHPVALRALSSRAQALCIVGLLALLATGFAIVRGSGSDEAPTASDTELSSRGHRPEGRFNPTLEQWASLTVAPVERHVFRPEHVTEGKIAVDEDRATPIFSPYSGRVTKLLAKPGDRVERGQALFVVEATDMVQAQNDFITGRAGVNKAHAQVDLAATVEKRLHELYLSKAIALREWQQAQADLAAAQSDLRAAETTLEAARNRLRILGKTDEEISSLVATGRISPETPIFAPIGGTIVQRKIGPGQYVSNSNTDPVFVIGDLATVWLTAFVRETDAARVATGQDVQFTVLAFP